MSLDGDNNGDSAPETASAVGTLSLEAMPDTFEENKNPSAALVRGEDGRTLLHVLAERSSNLSDGVQAELLEVLLRCGVDKDAMTTEGVSVLGASLSWASNNAATVPLFELLLSRGANVNLVGGWEGVSVLHMAALRNLSWAVDSLSRAGANLNVKDSEGRTPLHYAAIDGSPDAATELCGMGAYLNVQDAEGYTPLGRAALNRRYDVVKILLNHKADPNIGSRPPLHSVAADGGSILIDLVLGGANVRLVDSQGRTPLHHLCASKSNPRLRSEAAKILLDAGAQVDLPDAQHNTPIQLAIQYNQPSHLMRLLQARSASHTSPPTSRTSTPSPEQEGKTSEYFEGGEEGKYFEGGDKVETSETSSRYRKAATSSKYFEGGNKVETSETSSRYRKAATSSKYFEGGDKAETPSKYRKAATSSKPRRKPPTSKTQPNKRKAATSSKTPPIPQNTSSSSSPSKKHPKRKTASSSSSKRYPKRQASSSSSKSSLSLPAPSSDKLGSQPSLSQSSLLEGLRTNPTGRGITRPRTISELEMLTNEVMNWDDWERTARVGKNKVSVSLTSVEGELHKARVIVEEEEEEFLRETEDKDDEQTETEPEDEDYHPKPVVAAGTKRKGPTTKSLGARRRRIR